MAITRRTVMRKAFLAPYHPLVEQLWCFALATAQAATGVSHPGVARVIDAGPHAGGVFVAYERIEGARLADRLGAAAPPAKVVPWMRDALAALLSGVRAEAERAVDAHGGSRPMSARGGGAAPSPSRHPARLRIARLSPRGLSYLALLHVAPDHSLRRVLRHGANGWP